MSSAEWDSGMGLSVLLPSGQRIRLGELTGATLVRVVLKEQTAAVREVLESMLSGYLEARGSAG